MSIIYKNVKPSGLIIQSQTAAAPPTATYAISPNVASVNEGSTVSYTVTTSNVADGTSLYYTNDGTTSATDFAESGAISLNGSNQYLSVASPAASLIQWYTGSYTVEYWIKPSAFNSGGNGESPVIGNMGYNNTGTYWSFGPVAGGTVKFYYYNGSPQALSTSDTIPTNTWTHLALVNNAGSMKIYINGVSSATGSISGTPLSSSDFALTMGSSNSSYFNGSISNLRITNRAVYTANFTPSTIPLTVVANTSLLLKAASSETLVTDSSTNSYTVTNNGSATFNTDGPFGDVAPVVVINSNTGSFTKTLSADLTTEGSETIIMKLHKVSTSGPVVATANTVTVNDTSTQPVTTYAISPNATSVNEGDTVAYTVTTGGIGVSDGTTLYWTNEGTTSAADFTEGGSISLNGSNQYLQIDKNSAFDFGTGDFTVESWVNLNAATQRAYAGFYIYRGPSNQSSVLMIDFGGSGTVIGVNVAGNRIERAHGQGANTWFHLAVVRNSGTVTVYINGTVLISSANMGGSITQEGDYSLYIGSNPAGLTTYTMGGYISNLRVVKGTAVYTSEFTPSTTPLPAITNTSLLLNAKSSAAMLTDSSTNAFAVTNNGTATFENTNPFTGGSVALNGSSQYLSYANNSAHDIAGSDFTIEFFAKLNATSGAMISKYGAAGGTGGAAGETAGGYGWVIQYTASALRLVTGTGGDQVMSFAWTPVTGTWYHIAISRSGTNVKAFVNGTQIGSTATQTTPTYNSANQLQVGKTHTTSEYFDGNITNLRIVKGTALYTANFTAPTSELTAVANTSLLLKADSSTGMLVDSSTNGFTFTNNGTATWSPITPVSSSINSGSFNVYSNSATITRTLLNDLSSGEGSESLILNVRTTSTSGTVVATANTVTVNDTSTAPL